MSYWPSGVQGCPGQMNARGQLLWDYLIVCPPPNRHTQLSLNVKCSVGCPPPDRDPLGTRGHRPLSRFHANVDHINHCTPIGLQLGREKSGQRFVEDSWNNLVWPCQHNRGKTRNSIIWFDPVKTAEAGLEIHSFSLVPPKQSQRDSKFNHLFWSCQNNRDGTGN